MSIDIHNTESIQNRHLSCEGNLRIRMEWKAHIHP